MARYIVRRVLSAIPVLLFISFMIYGILLFCVPLVILEGFFAASEISLVSANRRRLHQRAEEGYRGAKMALKLLARPEFLLATTLLGAYMSSAANTIPVA